MALGDENRAVIEAYLKAWEQCDVTALDRLLADDFEHEVNGRHESRAGLIDRVAQADDVLSRRSFHVDEFVDVGDSVAVRCRLVGLHTGDLPVSSPLSEHLGMASIPATGREITITGMIIATISEGRLTSGYGEWNPMAMLTQVLGN